MNDKEAIERLKRDINTPLACGDTTIIIIDDLQTVLNLIEKQKAEIEKCKSNVKAKNERLLEYAAEIEKKDTLIHTMQAEFERLEDLEDNTDILKMELKKKNNTIEELKKENHDLKEKLQMFIPRRRVRRVYKMIGKILRTDIDPILLEEELKSEQL